MKYTVVSSCLVMVNYGDYIESVLSKKLCEIITVKTQCEKYVTNNLVISHSYVVVPLGSCLVVTKAWFYPNRPI